MGITEERIKRITEQADAIKAIGKAYVDVSGELDALVSDNVLMEAKIQGLEEANARLRERPHRRAYDSARPHRLLAHGARRRGARLGMP